MNSVRFSCVVAIAIIASLAMSCGTSSSGSGSGTDDEDTSGVGDTDSDPNEDIGGIDTRTDTPTLGDTGLGDTPEIGVDAGLEVGEQCADDEECETLLCVQAATGDTGFCSNLCAETADCPEGFTCRFLVNSGGDTEQVCVPDTLCIDEDEDGFGIGPGCIAEDCNDDAATVNLAADEICDGLDNDCDEVTDEDPTDASQICDTGFSGSCSLGRTRCEAGLLSCVADGSANLDICDGVDNDCDMMIDEGEDGGLLERECYTGSAGTNGVGACVSGFERCVGGSYTSCMEQTTPSDEVCDGIDNDCDGDVDEDVVGGTICTTDLVGRCRQGVTSCTDGAVICEPLETPIPEVCDAEDNDCDGAVDENVDSSGPLTRGCYTGPDGTLGVGACTEGSQTCEAGSYTSCSGETTPIAEICDGVDNNCNTMVDEGSPGAGLACTAEAMGRCAMGTTSCGGAGSECIPGTPTEEICNGEDDDCDGRTDEGMDGNPLTQSCYDGSAGTAGVGVCVAGTRTCSGGSYGSCDGQVLPGTETCDGRDNDCNGTPDDGNPGSGAACTASADGICAMGTTTCNSGAIECVPGSPGTEVCDGVDNNCNGTPDEGNPGGGISCTASADGICAMGTTRCSGGGIVCDPGPSGTETCNGLDDDCDGTWDEADGGGPLTQSCYDGTAGTEGVGICRAGTRTCGGGSYGSCQGQTLPGTEICDGLNNDCDASGTDEQCPDSISVGSSTSGSAIADNDGGSVFTDDCPTGYVLVGAIIRDDARIDRYQSRCQQIRMVETRAGSPWTYSVERYGSIINDTIHGGSGGSGPFTFTCPGNQVVIGFEGRGGDRVDQLRIRCGTIQITGSAPGSYGINVQSGTLSGVYGGNGGNPQNALCSGTQVAGGVYGRQGSEVDRIGIRCRNITLNAP